MAHKYSYLPQLEQDLKDLKRGSKLYVILKTNLKELGYWKNLKRGKPNMTFFKEKNEDKTMGHFAI